MEPMDENESLISAPPPPPEVKVRTMQSDLAAMAKSGGGAPRFESVRVAGWAPAAGQGPVANAAAAAGKRRRSSMLVLIVAAIVIVAALVGYFTYVSFFAGRATNPSLPASQSNAAQAGAAGAGTAGTGTPPPSSAPPAASGPSTASQAAAPAGPFTHVSLFMKPADQTLALTLSSGGPAQTAADLESFNQKLTALLAEAKKSAALIEINVAGTDGNGVAVGDILSEENAAVLDPQFLAAHFSPDATFFIYQDANGFWPGYVLALQPGENWLYLENDVAKLESSPAIANFFLTDVGSPAASGFTDSTVNGTAVRVLAYPGANPPAAFVYGWYGSRLILSASRGGFAAALAHLAVQ